MSLNVAEPPAAESVAVEEYTAVEEPEEHSASERCETDVSKLPLNLMVGLPSCCMS